MREHDSFTTGAQLRDRDGALTEAGKELAIRRLEKFARLQARIQSEVFSLTLSTAYVAKADYSDESLDNMVTDARDMRHAANELLLFIEDLAHEWRAQRDRSEGDDG